MQIVKEILAILRTRSWDAYVGALPGVGRSPDPASMLDRFGMWLHIGELPRSERGVVQVFWSANVFDPGGLVAIAHERLPRSAKRGAAIELG